jgi:hypothetical protein
MTRFSLAFLILMIAVSSSAESLARFEGTFLGCAVSGETWVPISTELKSGDGTISGTYVFIESSGRRVPGALRLLETNPPGSITLEWTDIYGSGKAELRFNRGGNRFDGVWSSYLGDGDRFPWNGVRKDLRYPVPDCTVPVS